jgi:uncharacterized protein (TIGR00297 family)
MFKNIFYFFFPFFSIEKLGSWATKFKKNIKERVDATATIASSRGASQVLGCSAIAVGCALAHAILCGEEQIISYPSSTQQSSTSSTASRLTCAIIAHYATCLGDTLASELGILSTGQPVLILRPWNSVPHGTNGGITMWGTLWSIIGGAIIGLSTVLLDQLSGVINESSILSSNRISYILTMIKFGAICGLIGSLLDSLLGATLQASYYDPDEKMVHDSSSFKKNNKNLKHISGIDVLSNVQVNIISVLLTTYLGACVIGPLLFTQ